MTISRLARVSCVSLLAIAASCSMSCALLFDLERGELAPEDEQGDDSGASRSDGSFDVVPPKGDAAPSDGSDVRLDTALDVVPTDNRFDTPTDGVPNDTVGDARVDTISDSIVDAIQTDTAGDVPRDGGIDISPPPDAPFDTTPPTDVVKVDVSPDAPRDVTVDPGVDTSRDAVVDTRPADITADPDWKCSPTTCQAGCCNNVNVCVPYATQDDGTCGVAGAMCAMCPVDNTCTKSGSGCQYQCSPTSCPAGCCEGNVCKPYANQNDGSCGARGDTCAVCPVDNTCTKSDSACQYQCSPTSCPAGCCEGNVCRPYANQNHDICGVKGDMCAACSVDRICAQSSAGCATWCGLRSAPAGVAAADYACADFETGMPPSNVWVPSIQESSTLQISNVALSVPNGLEAISPGALTSGVQTLLRWTGALTPTTVKKVSVSAAVNPGLFQNIDTDFQVLCAKMSTGLASRACIVIGIQGQAIRWQFNTGSGYADGECAANSTFAQQKWTNAEIHLDAVTGMVQALIGGVATNCQATVVPLEDSVGYAEVGLTAAGPGDFGLRVRYDNVEVSVLR